MKQAVVCGRCGLRDNLDGRTSKKTEWAGNCIAKNLRKQRSWQSQSNAEAQGILHCRGIPHTLPLEEASKLTAEVWVLQQHWRELPLGVWKSTEGSFAKYFFLLLVLPRVEAGVGVREQERRERAVLKSFLARYLRLSLHVNAEAVMFPVEMQHAIPIRTGTKSLYLLPAFLPLVLLPLQWNDVEKKLWFSLVLALVSPESPAVDDSEDTMHQAQVFLIVFTQQSICS